ncbi:hypothetical protein NEUTE2DRAFT_161650 [Neurospora tetrasperma FGSC 2509]|nr:hypothetical protein NEUTE2DRAFT_161650 [Neurospora tetrasperma FGSC 2509]
MKPGGVGALSSVDEYDNYDRADGGGGDGGDSESGMSIASTQERGNRVTANLDETDTKISVNDEYLPWWISVTTRRDTSDGDDDEDFQLRAPPRAHLRLSIHVTTSFTSLGRRSATQPPVATSLTMPLLRGLELCPWSTTGGAQALSIGSFPTVESRPEVKESVSPPQGRAEKNEIKESRGAVSTGGR